MLPILRIVFAFLLLVAAQTAPAQEPAIKKAFESRFTNSKVDSVTKTPFAGLYEVRIDNQLFYTDEKVSYIMVGELIDAKTKQNHTEERMQKLSAIKFDDLPFNQAIKIVRGNGRRHLAIFEDPNCSFCKRFEQDLARLDDVTVYVFLYPILSQNSVDKSKAVWCSADRAKAWSDIMLGGNASALAVTRNCDNPVDKNLELGRKMRIDGTPTTFLPNGQRIVGARFNDIKVALDDAAK